MKTYNVHLQLLPRESGAEKCKRTVCMLEMLDTAGGNDLELMEGFFAGL